MLGSDPHEDQEAPPSQLLATTGAPIASESQPTAEENKPAGNPREPQQIKAGPPKQGPGGQTPDPPYGAINRKFDENSQKQYNALSQRATPNKSLPVALPLKFNTFLQF